MNELVTTESGIVVPNNPIAQLVDQMIQSHGEKGLYSALANLLGYVETPPTINEFVDDNEWLGEVLSSSLFPVWRSGLNEIYPNPFFSPFSEVILTGCLTGDTLVKLLDGRSVSIEDLMHEFYTKKSSMWVYSYDMEHDEWVPGKISEVKPTGFRKVFKITLDNGKTVRATDNHPFLTKDKHWKRVDQLKIGDSLMPCMIEPNFEETTYEWIKRPDKSTARITRYDKWIPTHQMVAEWKYGSTYKNYNDQGKATVDIHHKDEDRHNNNPENLCKVIKGYHWWYHKMKGYWAWRNRLEREGTYSEYCTMHAHRSIVKAWENPEHRKFMSENTSKQMYEGKSQYMLNCMWNGPDGERHRENFSKRVTEYNYDPKHQAKARKGKVLSVLNTLLYKLGDTELTIENYEESVRAYIEGRKIKLVGIAKAYDCIDQESVNRFPEAPRYWQPDMQKLHEKWSDIVQDAREYNHKIIDIQFDCCETVFNLEVEKYHNYVLDCGIVSHNSIGGGKTTVAVVGALYDLLKLSLLDHPQERFKLLTTSKIVYAILNLTLGAAYDVVYDKMYQMLTASPRMRRMINQSSRTLFPKGIDVVIGSRPTHAIGMDVIGAILDEINFQTKVANQAYENYSNIKRRIQSRFLQVGRSFPARVWLVSSKKNEDDFLEAHIKKNTGESDTKVFNYPIWIVQATKIHYSGKTFKVFIGDQYSDPRILEGNGDSIGLDDARIIDVPIEYYRDFVYNIHDSLRDLAGVSLGSVFKYIPSGPAIAKALVFTNPVKQEVIRLDFWDKSDKLENYVDFSRIVIPQYRYNLRYIHIDMALKQDRLGLSSSFISEVVGSTRMDNLTGNPITISEPNYKTEFAIAIAAKPSSEIPIYKIKEFLIMLVKRGYPLAKVTLDGFQSANLMQDLKIAGINAEYLSVDRTRNPYDTFKRAINEGRWMGPKTKLIEEEINGLLDLGNKIDHPADGSKDITDSISGSMYAAYLDYNKYPIFSSMSANYVDNGTIQLGSP